jgi:hypothetical protein
MRGNCRVTEGTQKLSLAVGMNHRAIKLNCCKVRQHKYWCCSVGPVTPPHIDVSISMLWCCMGSLFYLTATGYHWLSLALMSILMQHTLLTVYMHGSSSGKWQTIVVRHHSLFSHGRICSHLWIRVQEDEHKSCEGGKLATVHYMYA